MTANANLQVITRTVGFNELQVFLWEWQSYTHDQRWVKCSRKGVESSTTLLKQNETLNSIAFAKRFECQHSDWLTDERMNVKSKLDAITETINWHWSFSTQVARTTRKARTLEKWDKTIGWIRRWWVKTFGRNMTTQMIDDELIHHDQIVLPQDKLSHYSAAHHCLFE